MMNDEIRRSTEAGNIKLVRTEPGSKGEGRLFGHTTPSPVSCILTPDASFSLTFSKTCQKIYCFSMR
jgi:hypothetical protein